MNQEEERVEEITVGLTGHSKERSRHLTHQFIVVLKCRLHPFAPLCTK